MTFPRKSICGFSLANFTTIDLSFECFVSQILPMSPTIESCFTMIIFSLKKWISPLILSTSFFVTPLKAYDEA